MKESSKRFLVLVGISLFVGFASGSYPAFFMSKFEPAEVLKGKFKIFVKKSFSKGLIIFQFAVSVLLIVSTAIIYN